jgi:hypothetical protein
MADLNYGMELLENYNLLIVYLQNYKKIVEDLVQVVSSQEKELVEKTVFVADLQGQIEQSGKPCVIVSIFLRNFLLTSALYLPCRDRHA